MVFGVAFLVSFAFGGFSWVLGTDRVRFSAVLGLGDFLIRKLPKRSVYDFASFFSIFVVGICLDLLVSSEK